MTLRRFAGQLVRSGRTRLARWRNRRPLVSGLPEGITWQMVDEISLDVRGKRLANASYRHISGWKEFGAFRLELTLSDASRWRLVLKDALYDVHRLPGLAGYPAHPGPAEFDVFSQAAPPLSAYLPAVYRVEELQPGWRYRYWLEDLSPDYGMHANEEYLQPMVAALPAMHRDLAEWSAGRSLPGFIDYQNGFYDRLAAFAEDTLRRLQSERVDLQLPALLDRWGEIAAAYANPGFDRAAGRQPVHGDLHLYNVLSRTENGWEYRLLDWEWAGFAQPHADLASLLKHRSAAAVRAVLNQYAALVPELSFGEHRRRLHWYRLDRALQDAAFMAAQILAAPPATGMNVNNFLNHSIHQALDSLTALQSDS